MMKLRQALEDLIAKIQGRQGSLRGRSEAVTSANIKDLTAKLRTKNKNNMTSHAYPDRHRAWSIHWSDSSRAALRRRQSHPTAHRHPLYSIAQKVANNSIPNRTKRKEPAQSKNKKLIINVKQLNENGTFRRLAADQSKPVKETQRDLGV